MLLIWDLSVPFISECIFSSHPDHYNTSSRCSGVDMNSARLLFHRLIQPNFSHVTQLVSIEGARWYRGFSPSIIAVRASMLAEWLFLLGNCSSTWMFFLLWYQTLIAPILAVNSCAQGSSVIVWSVTRTVRQNPNCTSYEVTISMITYRLKLFFDANSEMGYLLFLYHFRL